MGRPLKLNLEIQEVIVSLVRDGNSPNISAEIVGISRSTYFSWMKRGEEGESPFLEFSDSIKRAFSQSVVDRVAHISRVAFEGDWRASAWLLERLDPEYFGKRRLNSAKCHHVDSNSESPTSEVTIQSLEALIEKIQLMRVNS